MCNCACELYNNTYYTLVQVELYMAELYNKVGVGLMTWSPVSLGLALGSREEQLQIFTKLAVKVFQVSYKLCIPRNDSFNHFEGTFG
jgi:hypothetical protein